MNAEKEEYLKVIYNSVLDQLENNNPPEVSETFERLIELGIEDTTVMAHIVVCAYIETKSMENNSTPFNMKRYFRNLKNLPELPEGY